MLIADHLPRGATLHHQGVLVGRGLGDVPPGTSPARVNYYWPTAAEVRAARSRDAACATCTQQRIPALTWSLPAHLAPGLVSLPFGISLPLSLFADMGPKSIELHVNDLPPGMWAHLDATWVKAGVDRFHAVIGAGRGSIMKPYIEQNPQAIQYLSLNQFVQRYPEFVFGDYAGYVPPTPTNDERTKSDGVRKFAARGGWLISKEVFDGRLPIIRSGPVACMQWCRCSGATQWPEQAYCAQYVSLENDNFDWGVFVGSLPNDRLRITYQRLPKGTWDHIEDGIHYLTGKIRDALKYLCDHQGMVSAGAAAFSAGGAAAANIAMSRYCGATAPAPPSAPSPSAQPPWTPSRPPTAAAVPWYRRGSTYAIGASAVAAVGLAVLLARR